MDELQNAELEQAEDVQLEEVPITEEQDDQFRELAERSRRRQSTRKPPHKHTPPAASKAASLQIPVPAFLKHLGQDVKWYYDVRLWLPLFLILLLLAMCTGKGEAPAAAPTLEPTETPVINVTDPPVTEATKAPIDPDAEALAILAESVGANRSNNVKTIIMWIAINRSEAGGVNGYGLSLQEEIARPNQWQGYDPQASYSQEVYDIAVDVLHTVATGGLRPLDGDMYWLVLNDNGSVTVRNQFSTSGNKTWKEKTIK